MYISEHLLGKELWVGRVEKTLKKTPYIYTDNTYIDNIIVYIKAIQHSKIKDSEIRDCHR